MLTPKVKKDFDQWLWEKYGSPEKSMDDIFYDYPVTARFGIYQDYFWQEHNIIIHCFPIDDKRYMINIGEKKNRSFDGIKPIECLSISKAITTVITKASELVEDRL